MNQLRVLLVDDEPLALERLTALFRQLPDVEVVGTAGDGREASEKMVSLFPDLVMLDISMPKKSGLVVAAELPIEQRPEIVFVTAFEQFAPDAFEVDAADYLLKPVRFDRLRQAVERAKRRRALKHASERAVAAPQATSDHHIEALWVKVSGGQVRVAVQQIEWIEAAGDYVMLHTATRSYIHNASMGALEQVLNPRELTRVHRSTFVRPSLVAGVQRLGRGLIALEMSDGAVVQVGPNYTKAVLAVLGTD